MNYDFLKPPPPTKWNVLSLGAGVQSSALALKAAKGEITPMPDFAVFADTGAEPNSVYDWLNWLESQLPFPIHRVKHGDLTKDSLTPVPRKKDTQYGSKGDLMMRKIIPLFGELPDGEKTAAIGRICTADYKIMPIRKKIKELCGIQRGQKFPTVTLWMGISWDEIQRMKDSAVPWMQNSFPLIERHLTRNDCEVWVRQFYGETPPRSACYYCPFHSNDEWRKLKNEDPEAWSMAVSFDKTIRAMFKKHNPHMRMETFLHQDCVPLDQVDLRTDQDKGQTVFDFANECEGMCGI